MSKTRLLLVLLSLTCLSASLLLWPREFDAYYTSNRPEMDWVLAPDSADPVRPASVEAHYLTLQACDRTMASLSVALAPAHEQVRIARICLHLADGILTGSPSLSLAHMVRAQAMFVPEQTAPAFQALMFAEQTGAEISWMVSRRLDLASLHFRAAPDEAKAMMSRDILRTMRAGPAGIAFMAGLYGDSDDEKLRRFIVAVVEQATDAQQRQFLAAVKQLV